jgi:NAD+ diphosphatase
MLMTRDLARCAPEYRRRVIGARLPDYPFARAAHDRLSERRTDEVFLAGAWNDPATRVLVMRDRQLATNNGNDELRFISPEQAPPGERMLLGGVDGVIHFLVQTPDPFSDEPAAGLDETTALGLQAPDEMFSGLRHLATRLSPVHASLAVHAVALAGWHRRHPRCAVCGAATESAHAGALRRCAVCSAQHFPRTDPAVIMLVVDDQGRCLLGHNRARGKGWFSTLAGFVEPGETPEQAVAREVLEESGVVVGEVDYLGSQPWPFPSSLMLGYVAQAESTTITVDGEEITEARWFARAELREAVESGAVGLPTTLSIAGALITRWYGSPLPDNVVET